MNNAELQQRVGEIFEELCFLNDSIPIIVEGKNDEKALRKIGAKGDIIKLNIGQALLDFCEEIARKYSEVIILTDWDAKGVQLFSKLQQKFKYTPIKIHEKFWKDLKRFCSKDVLEVEYLTKFLST